MMGAQWAISDELWARVAPLIPPPPERHHGGRPRLDDRRVFTAMIFVLAGQVRWRDLPRELGAGSTAHARFREWKDKGFFDSLARAGLTYYPELQRVDWDWLDER